MGTGDATTADPGTGEYPPTCEVRNWRVFTDGVHKGDLFQPADVDEIARNFATVSKYRTPRVGLGHDKAKRLAASLGLPSAGDITGCRSDGRGGLYLDLSNVPTWVGAKINAGQYPGGSVELKKDFRLPPDPATVIPGRYLDGVALLGEEQPAVPGCEPPKAVFADGTPVPPNYDPVKVAPSVLTPPDPITADAEHAVAFSEDVNMAMPPANAAAMNHFSKPQHNEDGDIIGYGVDKRKRHDKGHYSETPVNPTQQPDLMSQFAALTPDQQAKCMAAVAAEPAPAPAVPPVDPNKPAVMGDTTEPDGDEPPWAKKLSAMFSDLDKRVSNLSAAYSEEAKKKDEQEMSAFSADLDALYASGKDAAGVPYSRKLSPAQWKARRDLAMSEAATAKFSADVRGSTVAGLKGLFDALPADPRLTSTINDATATAKPGLTPLQRAMVAPGSVLDRHAPRLSKQLRETATA